MPGAQLEIESPERQQESARLAALAATGILDTPAEPGFDAITRLAAEYFEMDAASISFADEGRIWIKSSWGHTIRELPRKNSVFDMVLGEDGPVMISDLSQDADFKQSRLVLRLLDANFFIGVPIRSFEGQILGVLTLFRHAPRSGFTADEMRMLESLAEMAATQLELRRLRRIFPGESVRKPRPAGAQNWPSKADLRKALERHQFVLHFQPEVELTTRRIVGLEALIRWNHPERGLVPPLDFIPLAERCGLILPIGDWGLDEACRQISRWSEEDPDNRSLRVCVNLSARQFSREGLADHVEALLVQSGITSGQLGLEMTESSLIPNLPTAARVLGRLRKLGVSLLVDDFGTGYSSLNHLHSFPFDVLKIDRSFVGRMTEGDQPRQIVRTIIELARVMGMDVVAEGIETLEQYQLLRQMGCRYGQGFLFARPLSVEAVTELLRLPGRILAEPVVAFVA